jgi:hypothetical protein
VPLAARGSCSSSVGGAAKRTLFCRSPVAIAASSVVVVGVVLCARLLLLRLREPVSSLFIRPQARARCLALHVRVRTLFFLEDRNKTKKASLSPATGDFGPNGWPERSDLDLAGACNYWRSARAISFLVYHEAT